MNTFTESSARAALMLAQAMTLFGEHMEAGIGACLTALARLELDERPALAARWLDTASRLPTCSAVDRQRAEWVADQLRHRLPLAA